MQMALSCFPLQVHIGEEMKRTRCLPESMQRHGQAKKISGHIWIIWPISKRETTESLVKNLICSHSMKKLAPALSTGTQGEQELDRQSSSSGEKNTTRTAMRWFIHHM